MPIIGVPDWGSLFGLETLIPIIVLNSYLEHILWLLDGLNRGALIGFLVVLRDERRTGKDSPDSQRDETGLSREDKTSKRCLAQPLIPFGQTAPRLQHGGPIQVTEYNRTDALQGTAANDEGVGPRPGHGT
ncbi:hypothetical protein JCM24511_02063 [Saitozyma sp. JCM 24511]|nr:hypothetical protein JCM24511_02063 [Saitozyma sp. JCM 24511]